MQAPCGVDEHQLRAALLGLLDHVVADARRIRAALAGDDVHACALTPHLELLDGGGAEGVGTSYEAGLALVASTSGELAHRGGLAGAVDAHKEDARGHVLEGVAIGRSELLGKALGQGVTQLVCAGEVLARRLLAQVVGHAHGKLAAHVAHHERVLEVLPEVLVDLPTHVEDLVDGLARAREAAFQPVEEAHQASTTFPVALSRR